MMRIAAFALAFMMFALALYVEMDYVLMLGFWDGFTSELDRAENVLARCFVWFTLAMGVWFIFVGFAPARANFRKRILYSCLVFVIAVGVVVCLDLYFRTYMMDSAGG